MQDCSSPYAECNTSNGTCEPDAVSIAASARGVQPSNWVPEVRRTSAELAAELRRLGFESDDQGRILFREFSMGGVILAFDPNVSTPATGFHNCLERIQACRVSTNTVDECVAAAPRCGSQTPWLDDEEFDCCPSECLLEYFDLRESKPPADAIRVAHGLPLLSGTEIVPRGLEMTESAKEWLLRLALALALILEGCAGCKGGCETRADCEGPYEDCNLGTKKCEPDAVSVAATAMGVQPTRWVPPRATPEQEEVDELFQRIPGFKMKKTPSLAFGECNDWILACRMATDEIDQCVAGARRCASAKPWLGDPAGVGCCPSACLLEYFELRKSKSPIDAILELGGSGCYRSSETDREEY